MTPEARTARRAANIAAAKAQFLALPVTTRELLTATFDTANAEARRILRGKP